MASAISVTQGTAKSQSSPSGVSATTFSFKEPYPVSGVPPSAVSALKQRRVSLASPSSPRVVQPWSFRDEMGLDSQSSDAAASSSSLEKKTPASPDKKGKTRRTESLKGADESSTPDKKPRKKWTQEETMMLVNGCQIVCYLSLLGLLYTKPFYNSMASAIGRPSCRTLILNSMIVQQLI